MRRSITFDNGTEFAYHHRLHKLSMRTFFCDAHAPWQKGGIENAIGRMRRGLPRKTDLATFSDDRLLSVVRSYNHTPRKCLNFKTPAEVLTRDLIGTAPFVVRFWNHERRTPGSRHLSDRNGE